jgi:ribosome-associated protein YbcJ (S4-like RNA binding protein)
MPHILLSPLVKWSFAALGGAMAVHWVVTEVKRVNEELEARRARVRIRDQERRPTLRRDPVSGEFRL